MYMFIVSRTTKTQVDNDNKTAVIRRRDAKLAAITLVCSQGHSIGATRTHDLQEAILANHGAPVDHSKILARRTNVITLVRLNSVGRAHPLVDLPLPTDLTMESAATILRWRQPTCWLEIFGSGGCRGGNRGGEGVRDRGSGAAAAETQGVSARQIRWG